MGSNHPAGWPDAFAILSSPSDGFPLDVYACGAIIRACEQNGQWGAALEALNYALEVSLKVGFFGGLLPRLVGMVEWLVEVYEFQWGKRPYRHVRGC